MQHFKDKRLLISAVLTTALTTLVGINLYGALGAPAQAQTPPANTSVQLSADNAPNGPYRAF